MADQLYSSAQAIENKQSFYNVIRKTGQNRCPFFESLGNSIPFKGDPKKGIHLIIGRGQQQARQISMPRGAKGRMRLAGLP